LAPEEENGDLMASLPLLVDGDGSDVGGQPE
jgi:hypothetical protein